MPLRPTPQIARIYLLVAALLLATPGLCSLYSRYEGKVLVALPRADADPYFARTLVYVGQHNGWGTIGLILNRPLSAEHFAMLEQNAPPGFDWRFGGPIDYQNTRYVLVPDDAAPQSPEGRQPYKFMELQDYIRTYPEAWSAMRADPEKRRKFIIFAGYSGWRSWQLENEMRIGGWAVTDFSPDMLNMEGGSAEVWGRVLKDIIEKRPPKAGRI